MVRFGMATKIKARARGRRYTLGRHSFAKISEVEGIKTNDELEADFREFDRKGLSASERRRILARKYGPQV